MTSGEKAIDEGKASSTDRESVLQRMKAFVALSDKNQVSDYNGYFIRETIERWIADLEASSSETTLTNEQMESAKDALGLENMIEFRMGKILLRALSNLRDRLRNSRSVQSGDINNQRRLHICNRWFEFGILFERIGLSYSDLQLQERSQSSGRFGMRCCFFSLSLPFSSRQLLWTYWSR